MNLIYIALLFDLFTGPVDNIAYINTGSFVDVSLNQITLNAEFTVNNNYVFTADIFYDTVDVNISDYSFDLVDVNKITQKINFGSYRLQADNFIFNYRYDLYFYDFNDVLMDNVSITRNLTIIFAEPFNGGFANTASSITSTNLVYDYNASYSAGYDVGYDTGYDAGNSAGYESGYDDGYESGYDDGYWVGNTDLNNVFNGDWVGWLGSAVTGFFALEIFPNFTLGGVIGAIICVWIWLWILKVFAGG